MRVNEHFEQMEERIRKLEKEVAALKKADAAPTKGAEKAAKPKTATKAKAAAK